MPASNARGLEQERCQIVNAVLSRACGECLTETRHPDRLLRLAVTGMLPKNRLGRRLATKLKIYPGPDHPHAAQQPVVIDPLAASN